MPDPGPGGDGRLRAAPRADLGDLRDLHRATLVGGWGEPVVDDALLLRTSGARPGSVDLPDPQPLPADLGSVLAARRSARHLRGGPVPLVALSTLLLRAAGLRDGRPDELAPWAEPGPRTYPSGGALYPVEVLVLAGGVPGLPRSVYRLQPLSRRLVPQPGTAAAEEVLACFPDGEVDDAAAVVLLAADLGRPSLARYGAKEYRLLLLEAGHVAQNLLLVGTALGLATLPTCGFDDDRLARACGLVPPDMVVVCAVAVAVAVVVDGDPGADAGGAVAGGGPRA